MSLGENIYKFRTRAHMSQGDLADALEVSRQSVSKWENNAAVPELDKLIKMSELFETSLDELVSGKQANVPSHGPQLSIAHILALASITLSGVSLAISVLFGNILGLHASDGISLFLVFALAGVILLKPLNLPLLKCCLWIYLPIACLYVLFYFLWGYFERGAAAVLAIGCILALWWMYLRKRGGNV